MRKKTGSFVLAAAMTALSLSAGGAFAAGLSIDAKPFNPGGIDVTIVAAKVGGAGNPGYIDKYGWVLALSSTVPFPLGASADLTVKGIPRIPGYIVLAGPLGFDYLNTSHCTGGAPRISVETIEGGSYAFGCASGTHVDQLNGWTRVTFSNADVQFLGGPPWPGFGAVNANFIQLLLDEGPAMSIVDNILIDTTNIGK